MSRQKHPKQQSQQQQAYSPEYSSPISTDSMLQARFTKASPQLFQGELHYGPNTKENFNEVEQLPIFQEVNTSMEQMIPQVTVVSYEASQNNQADGGGGMILSDGSDELLIRQLQLNVEDKRGECQSSSNALFDQSLGGVQSMPLSDKQNVISPQMAKDKKIQEEKHRKNSKSNGISTKKPVQSPVRHNFAPSSRRSPGIKTYNSNKAITKPISKRPNKPSQDLGGNERIERAPVPHPYPEQKYIMSEITDTFDGSQTVTTNNKETSPAFLSNEKKLLPYRDEIDSNQLINTDSSKKDPQDTRLLAFSASNSPAKQIQQQIQQPSQAAATRHKDVIVHEFVENSTIEEQPTEEQLATMLTCNRWPNQNASSQPSGLLNSLNAAVSNILNIPHAVQGQGQQQKDEIEESLEQIRLINQVIQQQMSQTNHSPEKQSDISDSLKDFSLGQAVEPAGGITAVSNEFYYGAPLIDFENSYKNRTSGMAMNTASHLWQDNASIAGQKDNSQQQQNNKSFNQNKPAAATHYIQANVAAAQQQVQMGGFDKEEGGSSMLLASKMAGQTLKPDSTLLNINENSKSNLADQCQRQQQLLNRSGSARQQQTTTGRSPNQKPRAVVYGQCQVTPDELYKPVLRNAGVSGSKKTQPQQDAAGSGTKFASSTKSIVGPTRKFDFGVNRETFGVEATPPRQFQQAFLAAGTQAQSLAPPNAANNLGRKNFSSLKRTTSVSPSASRLTSSNAKNQGANSNTMLQKYGVSSIGQTQRAATMLATTVLTRNQLNNSPIPSITQGYSSTIQHARDRFTSNATILSQSVKNKDLLDCKVPEQPEQQFKVAQSQPYSRPTSSNQTTTVQSNGKSTPGHMSNNSFARLKHNLTNTNNGGGGGGARPNKPNQQSIIASTATTSVLQSKSVTPITRSPKPTRTGIVTAKTTQATTITTEESSRQRFAAFENALQLQQRSQERLMAQERALTPNSTSTQVRASPYQLRRVTDCLKSLDIQTFLEIERIKKPSAAILAIARMSCTFFEAMRNRDPVIMDQVQKMISWNQIQEYMRTQLTCCVPELRTLLKQKVPTLGRLNGENSKRETEIEALLEKINQTYFSDSKIRVIRRFILSSKPMKALVHLIYAFVCLALNLEREFKLDNLLGVSDSLQLRTDEQYVRGAFNPPLKQNVSSTAKSNRSAKSNSLVRNRSRDKSRDNSNVSGRYKTIDPDQSNSTCSKCSCHMKNSRNSGTSNRLSVVSAKRSENPSRKSIKSPLASNPPIYLEQNQYENEVANPSNPQSRTPYNLYTSNAGQMRQPQTQVNTESYGMDAQANKRQEQDEDLVNVMSQRAFSPPAMTMTMSVASLAQQPQLAAPASQTELPISNGSTTPSTKGRKTSRQIVGFLDAQKMQQQQPPAPVQEVQKRSKRKSAISTGSDFASVVRASVTSIKSPAASGLTPIRRANQKATHAPIKEKASSAALTARQHKKPQSQMKYAATQKIREEKAARKGASPVTPTRSTRQRNHPLSKVPSNLTTVSQKRASHQPAASTVQPQYAHQPIRHQRTSTLYKATASTTAKGMKQASGTQSKSQILARATSAKAIATTSNAREKKATTKQSQRQQNNSKQRKSGKHSALVHQADVDHFLMLGGGSSPTMTFSDNKMQQEPDLEISGAARAETSVPNFGGMDFYTHELNTEDMQREPSPIAAAHHEEDSSRVTMKNMTKQGTHGDGGCSLLQNESFARNYQHDSFMMQHLPPQQKSPPHNSSSLHDYKRPASPRNSSRYQVFEASEKRCQYDQMMLLDSLEEPPPSGTPDGHRPSEDRTSFILQQAQAITENINSCYKTHNMPQIDMATIEKLKMRRMQFMKDQAEESDSNSDEIKHETRRTMGANKSPSPATNKKYRSSKQSCNVLTTMTVETQQTIEHDNSLEGAGRKHEVSFTEALNKLKAEVENLMAQRINR